MPARSSKRLKAKERANAQHYEDNDNNEVSSSIMTQIQALLSTAREMEKEMKALRSAKQELQDKVEAQEEVEDDKGARKGSSSKQIAQLEKKVRELKESQQKDKRKIQAMKARELKFEAENLTNGGALGASDGDETDLMYKMRKLLRKFSDLVVAPTLADDGEHCAVCFEDLKLRKTSSFPCEHSICNDCLPGISRGADETIKCPHCRQDHPRDSVELVQYTERERWDALLDVAKAWCAIDVIAEAETSEEEAEEDFIDDDDETASSAPAEEGPSGNEGQDNDLEIGTRQLTPPPNNNDGPSSPMSYANSPSREKRARMMQLAEERNRKRSRYT